MKIDTTITATRTDATGVARMFQPKVKTPEALVDDALLSFTQAEAKLSAAVTEISRQEAALLVQRDNLDVKIDQAQTAKSRLGRISQRITDLLA